MNFSTNPTEKYHSSVAPVFVRNFKRNVSKTVRRFRESGDVLPTSISSSASNPQDTYRCATLSSRLKNVGNKVKGIEWDKIETPPVVVQFSWLVVLVALYLIISGGCNLRDYSLYSEFSCDYNVCKFSEFGLDETNPHLPVVTEFDRKSFERTNSVRIRNGVVTPVAGLKRRQLRKLGYSYSITYKHMFEEGEGKEGGEVRELLLSRSNLGKRSSRERMSAITNKMRNSKQGESFTFSEGLGWNVSGCVRIMSGIMFLALITMVGEFSTKSYNQKIEDLQNEYSKRDN